MSSQTAFVIGATGFVGGHLVELLSKAHPDIHLKCLIRNASPPKVQSIKKLNSNVSVVEGTLEDAEILSQNAKTADIVIHLAHSDHLASVEAVLSGLQKQVEESSQARPLYLHMSGLGSIADNVRGEKVENTKEWTDVGLQLSDCPPNNTHLACDRKIVEAGTKSNGRIRTRILFPGLIYGLGKDGRSSMWISLFADFAKAAGHAGTWGPGEVTQYCVHVRDVAQAVLFVLNAQLDGKIPDDDSGLFFITSEQSPMTWKEITDIMGDVMFSKGLLKEPGSKPFPSSITDPLGDYGWSLLGSNGHGRADRLREMGWDAEWSKKETLQSSMQEMLEVGVGAV